MALAFALEATVIETQTMLYCGKAHALYEKSKRDAIILYALSNACGLDCVNALLFENGVSLL